MKKSRKQASRENGAEGGRKAQGSRRAHSGAEGGVADNEGGDEVAPTATNMPWSDGNGEAAAAEPLEAADDIADERNSAALTEEGAPEAPATSATSGGNDATPTLAATNVDAAEPLEVADDARAAWEREFARAAVALDARDASSQVGLAPLDPMARCRSECPPSTAKWTRETKRSRVDMTPNGKKHGRKRERGARKGKRRGKGSRERERERERQMEAAWERERERER